MYNKFFIAGLFFVFIILSGLWLSRTGRPLNVFILTIHKLVSLGALAFLVISVYRIHLATPLSPAVIIACAVTLLFFIVLIATGGLLSTAKAMPITILKVHQIMPYLLIISTAANLYLVLIRKS
ncbi:MAG: hypothetical protein HGA53_02975 [Anaerolineaceae bacterium]|nr:hypothetical protein [Anaerolineaceae bacterium]NTV35893.1 hypothetical protein [Anaerolineaceae bacterium]